MKRLALIAALAASPAAAQNIPPVGAVPLTVPCYGTEAYATDMGERGMHIASRGLIVASTGALLAQLWVHAETGAWAWAVVNARGQTCQIADGEAYDEMAAPPPGDPA